MDGHKGIKAQKTSNNSANQTLKKPKLKSSSKSEVSITIAQSNVKVENQNKQHKETLSKSKTLHANEQTSEQSNLHSASEDTHQSKQSHHAEVHLITPINKNTVAVTLNSKKTNGLLDTGASISCANKEFLEKALQQPLNLQPSHITSIVGVGGEHHPVAGVCTVTLNFSGLNIDVTFHVISNLHHSIILGIDFMERNKVKIDMEHKKMIMHDSDIKVLTIQSDAGVARTIKPLVLPAKSEVDIAVRVSCRKPNETVLLEPFPALAKANLAGAKCLVTLHKNKATVRLMNPTENDINLPCKTTVALVSDVDINSITTFHDPNAHQAGPVYACETTSASSQPTQQQNAHAKQKTETDHAPNFQFDLSDSDLSPEQKTQLEAFLYRNKDIFSTGLHDLGHSTLQPHVIETNTTKPVKMPFYRQTPVVRQEIDRQVNDMLANGIVTESNSAWHSPVVLVKKSDGKSYRFAVDYRKLNAVTKPQCFPLPRLQDIFDALGESKAQYFTSVDMAFAYWQVSMDPDSREKAAFITHNGIYEFNVMPYGLMNSPATFSSLRS